MIICGHSYVRTFEGGWRIDIPNQVASSLNLFPGQNVFSSGEQGSLRHFLSPLKLNPYVSYFRVFLEDVMGSLATTTKMFSDRGINILNSAAFGFGNIWVSEYVADFKDVDASPETITSDIEGIGGFVTSREITELFPKAFNLKDSYPLKKDENSLYLVLPKIPDTISEGNVYAILKAWPQVEAIFMDFIAPGTKLLKINAMIEDVPGALNKLTSVLGTQVNMHAIYGQHHEAHTGEWTIYGVLEVGELRELKNNLKVDSTILDFEVEALGWNPV